MNAHIWGDFQICISVPLNFASNITYCFKKLWKASRNSFVNFCVLNDIHVYFDFHDIVQSWYRQKIIDKYLLDIFTSFDISFLIFERATPEQGSKKLCVLIRMTLSQTDEAKVTREISH